jgi:hypothetical protein
MCDLNQVTSSQILVPQPILVSNVSYLLGTAEMSEFQGAANVALADAFLFGAVKEECKFAVASLDFGTACSGVAFALKSVPNKIKYGAPTANDAVQAKVPTVLLELPETGEWCFGNHAETKYNEIMMATQTGEQPRAQLYRGFKMALKGKDSGFDTLQARSTAGNPQLLMTLVVKSLQFLKDYTVAQVKLASGNNDINPAADIQWVLTVPAIWNDFGKAFMRKAAFHAGLVADELSDDLILVLEPEGASLAVHVGAASHNLLAEDSRFMVLDCGGGTIDITTHEVQTVKPLAISAIAPPSGSDWGGERVNAQFREFLQELLGPDLFDEHGQLLAFHTIYSSFDVIKQSFTPDKIPTPLQLVDVLNAPTDLIELAAVWNANHPGKLLFPSPNQRKGIMTMSTELMLSFFEPSIQSVLTEAKKVLSAVQHIQYIIVVGGFGSSQVLIDRVRQEFHKKNGVLVILPDGNPKPQGAIAHGAVYFGLYNDLVASRVSPYTYGVAVRIGGMDEQFKVLVTKGEVLQKDHEVMLVGRPTCDDAEHVKWAVYRSDQEQPTTTLDEHLLGHVAAPCPRNPDPKARRQYAYFRFGRSEITVSIKGLQGETTKAAITM